MAIVIAVGCWMIYMGVETPIIVGMTGIFAAYLFTLLVTYLGWHGTEQADPSER